jgi:membrane protein DedA with SNARE-associated domain
MPWSRFPISNAAGGIAWACLYGFGAYALGEQVKHIAGPVGIALAVIAAMVIGAAILAVGMVRIGRNLWLWRRGV